MINIAEIIANQFLEQNPKDFPSNKILKDNDQKEKKFEKTLNETQLAEYRQLASDIAYYYTARADELVEFTFEFLRTMLNTQKK